MLGASSETARATLLLYAILLAVTAVAWVHVLREALGPDPMAGMDMPMTLGLRDAAAYVMAWGVMMAAMMLPSALPMIGLYAATQRSAGGGARAGAVALFTLIYVAVWTASGVPAYLASGGLVALGAETRAGVVAAVLVAAGAFQLSPLKQVCLRHCRSPLGFFLGRWRAGWRGALALGGAHAAYCLGCCWALMVVLVLAGAMGLAWVLLIAAVVAAEKLLPGGAWMARATGVALLVLGAAVLARPDLAALLRGAPVM